MAKRATLAEALKWVSERYGLTLPDDREKAVDLVNRIVEEAYNEFPDVRMLSDVEECFQLQKFCDDCHQCRNQYWGITLPTHMEHVTAAWINDTPIKFYSMWREYATERAGGCRGCKDVDIYDVAGEFATERDIFPCGCADKILIKATIPQSEELFVHLKVTKFNGEKEEIELPLSDEWVSTEDEILSVDGVILPTGRVGGVIIAQGKEKRVLSQYGPNETVPCMKRIKIDTNCDKYPIRIRGARRQMDVYYDTDILPIGSRRFFEEGARYFKFLDDGSSNELFQRADAHRTLMLKQLEGIVARDNGDPKADTFFIGGIGVRKGRLPSSRLRNRCNLTNKWSR